MNTDEQIEYLLSLGHPESDSYQAPSLDTSRVPTLTRTRRTLTPLAGAAALLAAVIVLAVVNLATRGSSLAGSPSAPAPSVQSSSPASAPAKQTGDIEVVMAADPRAAVMGQLARRGTGCWVTTHHDFIVDRDEEWDARIEATGIDHGWLDDSLWVGDDRSEVARAFGGTWAAYAVKGSQGEEDMWIVTERNGYEVGLQLFAWHTPHGHNVWQPWNTVAVDECPDGSGSPAISGAIPVATAPPATFGMDARGVGTLGGKIERDQACFWLVSDQGSRTALIWPYGFTAQREPLRVLASDGSVIAAPGDRIEIGGGAFPGPPTPKDDPCGIGKDFIVSAVVSVNGAAPSFKAGS